MAVKHKSRRTQEVHIHHSLANFLLPLGLAIVAVLIAYMAQYQFLFFRQALYWLIGFGIMFAALHILIHKKKLVHKNG
ncbi:MAG: hypothetical protein AABX02_00615 [archaeon]